MKRLHILCLALLAAATLGGCHRYLAREVRIVPKDVETYGSAGVDVTLHVANRGGRPLRFEAAVLSLAYDGGEVLRATLRDTVTVASGWEGDVRMRCRLRVPDRAALYAVFSAVCVGLLALMGDFGTALIFFVTFLLTAFMRSGDFKIGRASCRERV